MVNTTHTLRYGVEISGLDLTEEAKAALAAKGFKTLYPPQAEAVPIALSGSNLVVAVPTASGKSLIGYLAALKTVTERKSKVLYIVPLKALATEKAEDLADLCSGMGYKVAVSIGDLDSDGMKLGQADIIVATSEKADSLLRHGGAWMGDVGLVIADEIHMIHDPSRGPTLEVALTKMMRRYPKLQIIALSATITNARDLADWLRAELVTGSWRPIVLKQGVFNDWVITFDTGGDREIPDKGDVIWSLMEDTVREGGQCLVFVNSRRSTESLASKYSSKMAKISGAKLEDAERKKLEGDAESTSLGRKLASCVASGMAFHNAGLTAAQRRMVERGFLDGNIKCIVATPTLAAGINLPARRVIVRDTGRFEANAGYVPISVMEVKQMCGRAGRPGYDPYGEAVLIAKGYDDYRHLMDDYILTDSEDVTSKLVREDVLITHILGIVATGDAVTEDGIVDFLRDTFYGTVSSMFGIESLVEDTVDFLCEQGMLERMGDRLEATRFGRRISDLFINPRSAVILREAVGKIDDGTRDFPILFAVASTPDVLGLYPRKADEEGLWALYEEWSDRLLHMSSEEVSEFILGDVKVAALAMEWISERDEDIITEALGIGPGDIRSRMDMMEWILYAMGEVATIYRPEAKNRLRPLVTRVRHGIREELLDLISLKGVGRVRARVLFDNGIRTRADVARVDIGVLAGLPKIGVAIAKSMKEQVGSVVAPVEMESLEEDVYETGSKQSNLFDFN